MAIIPEQVADLRKGDVVTIRWTVHPDVVVTGPLRPRGGGQWVGPVPVIGPSGELSEGIDITVVSRAPRPLYVNHPRPESHLGDVVRDADDDESPRTWTNYTQQMWRQNISQICEKRSALPARLRLLVDGETGQVVPGQPAGDPLAHIAKGDPTPEGADENPTCGAMSRDWACTRKPDHVGQHIAGCGIGNSVAAVWS